MFLASSFLRCRPVPFRTQTTSSFIARRLFRTSINRSLRQTNIKYASPSPSPPRWKGLAAKLFSLRTITVPLDMVALTIENSRVSRSRLIRFATKIFIFCFILKSAYYSFDELWKLRRSPSQWKAYLGDALSCVPFGILCYIGPSRIWRLRKSPSPWTRLATRFFIYVPFNVSIFMMYDMGLQQISLYPKSPPRLRKSLDDPLSYQHDVLPQGYISIDLHQAWKTQRPN